MIAEIWLKIEGKKKYNTWSAGEVNAHKKKPSLRENEICVKLYLEIPDEIFEEPVFEAKLKLPKNIKNLPDLTEISKSIGNELTKQTGFKIKLSVPEGEVSSGK